MYENSEKVLVRKGREPEIGRKEMIVVVALPIQESNLYFVF